jgi:ribosomal protein L29
MESIKSKGSVEEAIKHLNNMSATELKSKLEKIKQEMAEKRASKKAARMSAQ